jgi:ABC-2 type transport system ATP-binding protein
MIEVKQLTRSYGKHRGVSELNFSIEPGQIVGLLGPNGAGKSTTIRVLCSQLLPSSGSVTIFGKDIVEHPLSTRRLLGYLPENAPLYQEMICLDYLKFVASLHGLTGKKADKAIDRVSQSCDLKAILKRPLDQVSRGYRQRSALAASILHDPKVLILDEPTASLDPNQVADVHALIRQLGQEITIIFSSHILSEVEQLCERVLILNQGKLIADSHPKTLGQGNHILLEVRAPSSEVKKHLKDFGDIKVLKNTEELSRFEIQGENSQERCEAIAKRLAENNLAPCLLQPGEHVLQEIFAQLTEGKK